MELGLWVKQITQRFISHYVFAKLSIEATHLTVFKLCCMYIEPGARSTEAEALSQTFCIRIFRSRTQESTFLTQFSSLSVNCQFDEYCSKCLPVLFQGINDDSSIN